MNERNQFKGVNSIKFNKAFSTDEDCFRYLADIKWKETEFQCKKCGHTKYCHGVKPFSRRCMKCKYDESPTAGTLFDKCKFPLQLAFHIAFKISTKKKGMSSSNYLESLNFVRRLVGNSNGKFNKLCKAVNCIQSTV